MPSCVWWVALLGTSELPSSPPRYRVSQPSWATTKGTAAWRFGARQCSGTIGERVRLKD
jgi:hypothetical protein